MVQKSCNHHLMMSSLSHYLQGFDTSQVIVWGFFHQQYLKFETNIAAELGPSFIFQPTIDFHLRKLRFRESRNPGRSEWMKKKCSPSRLVFFGRDFSTSGQLLVWVRVLWGFSIRVPLSNNRFLIGGSEESKTPSQRLAIGWIVLIIPGSHRSPCKTSNSHMLNVWYIFSYILALNVW